MSTTQTTEKAEAHTAEQGAKWVMQAATNGFNIYQRCELVAENVPRASFARLIAAAPELLEVALALVGAAPKYGTDGVCKLSTQEVVEMARAAIAKAEKGAL